MLIAFFVFQPGATARRESIEVLSRLQAGLEASDPNALLDTMVQPETIRNRSAPEQVQFLRKALLDELSAAGLAELEAHGRFGPLPKIFPDEAEAWANQAGVSPDDCVAFRLERNDHRAEVVLVEAHSGAEEFSNYRIIRVNNVRQMAEPYP